ncbi:MAG: ribosome-associated translation inhibitor RaiA [Holophagales bacterium]|nr:MAG: ribosome-associated translation inhibitor RaiA [Holophagales bacterium]
MKIDYVARNFELDERLKSLTAKKLAKVAKFLSDPVEARVALSQEKFRFTCDLHVAHRAGELHSNVESHDAQEALESAIDGVEEQAKRGRQKSVDRRRRANRAAERVANWPVSVVEPATLGNDGGPQVLRTEHMPIKPMSLEEAAMALEDSEHGFVVFRDATSEKVSVLYRRKDDNFGLIAPEL